VLNVLILLVKSQAIWLINPSVCKELNKYRELGLAASEIESLDQYALHQLFSDAPPKELTKKNPDTSDWSRCCRELLRHFVGVE
jgi:hypothetical protein